MSSRPVPARVIEPVSSTNARCERLSAWLAFCSTSRIVVPCALISLMILKMRVCLMTHQLFLMPSQIGRRPVAKSFTPIKKKLLSKFLPVIM